MTNGSVEKVATYQASSLAVELVRTSTGSKIRISSEFLSVILASVRPEADDGNFS